jgi:hypothetical protein
MCRRISCSTCGKPSYAGCGLHIEQVLGDVAKAERCTCREEKAKAKADRKKASGSLFSRIFGR